MIASVTIVLVNGIVVIIMVKPVAVGSGVALSSRPPSFMMVKPGGSGAAGVDVDVDPIALVRGRHEHVLTRVVASIAFKCNHKIKVRLNLTKKL